MYLRWASALAVFRKASGYPSQRCLILMQLCKRQGLVQVLRIGQWNYYKRNEAVMSTLAALIGKDLRFLPHNIGVSDIPFYRNENILCKDSQRKRCETELLWQNIGEVDMLIFTCPPTLP